MGSLTEGMSQRFELSWVTYDTQRPEYANQSNYISFGTYDSLPPWHTVINGATIARNIITTGDTFVIAGNATTTMNSNGMTQLTAVAGQDDSSAYIPLPFTFFFFGTNFSNTNPTTAPAFYWNTNNVLGFGTQVGTINWLSNTGPAITIGNTDRRTNTFFYTGLQTSGGTNYMTMLLWAQNIYNDGIPNRIRYQIRLFRSPNYQYVELRINGFGATNGNWNITNGTTFQNTFGAYTASAGTSWVLRSDLNGSNWTFSNNYHINLP